MFDWLMQNKVDKIIPDALSEQFEKTYIEPLKRQKRDGQIAEQLRIDQADKQVEERLNELVSEEDVAKTKLLQVERTFADVQSKLTVAKQDWWVAHSRTWELRQERETLKSRKARFGSELVTAFVAEMLTKWDVLRNAGRDEEREGQKRSLTGKTTTRKIWTNRPAIGIAIAYIRAAMVEAEAMMSEPLSDFEIKTRLDVLRQGIPLTGEWVVTDVQPTVFTEAVVPRYGERQVPSYS